MTGSIYHMTLKLLNNRSFGVKTSIFCHLIHNVIMDITLPNLLTTSGLSIVLHGVKSHSHTQTRVVM